MITNADELIEKLHLHLQDYLVAKVGEEAKKKVFRCYVHDDSSPSMSYISKTGNVTVHCHGCGVTHNIFNAAHHFDNLPLSGTEWMTQTLPALAEMFGIKAHIGEPSPVEKERIRMLKFMNDVANVLTNAPSTPVKEEYLAKRGWSDQHLIIANVSKEYLATELEKMGWSMATIASTLMYSHPVGLIGESLITFVIKDYRGRPVALSARNLTGEGAKYINSPESVIYEKRKILFGLDTALPTAKKNGIYLVEGQGDLAALHKHGILNAVASCGTAFTADHLSLLKMLGVKKINFALDWDSAGQQALRRILKEELKLALGLSCYVVEPPLVEAKDVGDLLLLQPNADAFLSLKCSPAFEWVLHQAIDTMPPEDLCAEMIPIIATEQASVRRELLIKVLSDTTGITIESIKEDVQSIRDKKVQEKNERIKAATEKYKKDIESDPNNAQTILSQHHDDLVMIEKEFTKRLTGVDYQLSRYDALQDMKLIPDEDGNSRTEFKMNYYTFFAQALADNMPWTEGALFYFGGRANSGKTATVIALSLDIALSDADAIVVMHFTDDTYAQVEPRIKSNIANMLRMGNEPALNIGACAAPRRRIQTEQYWELYSRADKVFRTLLEDERLVILDNEDGPTLSVLDRNLRMIRAKYPDKKILVACDNTHNYQDFPSVAERTERMTRIADTQKSITGKYRCTMFATAEYRKNSPLDKKTIRLPVDDDLADARALMYRPNVIIHVYQDLHDREDHASIYWTKPDSAERLPRLMLVFSKNKISSFKDKLILDLDSETVSLKQTSIETARFESAMHEKRESMKKNDDDLDEYDHSM